MIQTRHDYDRLARIGRSSALHLPVLRQVLEIFAKDRDWNYFMLLMERSNDAF